MEWNGVVDFADSCPGAETIASGNVRNMVMHKGSTFPTGTGIPVTGQMFYYTGVPVGASIPTNSLCQYSAGNWLVVGTVMGASGYSGYTGESGYSGYSGTSGAPGGDSGYSGIGTSGYSGYSSSLVGVSGYSGNSGYSGSASGITGILGVWSSKSNNVNYLAATDGFVCAYGSGVNGSVEGYTDATTTPSTLRVCTQGDVQQAGRYGLTMPVRKGDYWKVTGATNGGFGAGLWWIPLGS